MSNVQLIPSQSFPNAGFTDLPGPPNLQATDNAPLGINKFAVGEYDSFSYHVFLTGSGNGTLSLGFSNNCQAFVPQLSASVSGSNINQEIFFGVPENYTRYAKLWYSGSGPGQLTGSVALYGRKGKR